MKYMDVKTASEKWGITTRRVRILCNDGRVDGAVRNGWSWMIPDTAPKPRDGRVLRRFKNLDIKPGSIDVARMRRLQEAHPVNLDYFRGDIGKQCKARTLAVLFSFEANPIAFNDIMRVLNGELAYNLTLKEHILIINFSSILNAMVLKDSRWTESDLRQLYIRLMQGVEDVTGEYRDGFVSLGGEGKEKVKVSVAMETMVNQYENTWSELSGVVSATILAGEVSRIWPFQYYRQFFMFLVLSGELLRNGILPPVLDASLADEAKASYALVRSKGIYNILTSFVERLIVKTYAELEANV